MTHFLLTETMMANGHLKEKRRNWLMDQRIVDCETSYYQCFAQTTETADVLRLRDPLLQDMYYHNISIMKASADTTAISGIVERERAVRLGEKAGFLNILSFRAVDDSLIIEVYPEASLSLNGYYQLDISFLPLWKVRPGCTIERISSQAMVEDALYSDLQLDGERLGRDFCTRRVYRRSKVYMADEGVDSYNCYDNGQMVGNCDLFIHKGVAKIEDFTIIPQYQRQGYGTTILKYLVQKALDAQCHIIYLVTDEDDTPKQMYTKLGFYKIGERTDMFFDLTDHTVG